ncbi:MAG: TolC family protein [FCB group bacterium]|nr:TolC family protein [FCB group bacterium]
MKKAFLIFTAFLVVAWGSVAAETYTLEECVQMAVATDPNLVSFRNSVKTAGAGVWQSAGGFLPSASVSYNSTEITSGPESPQLRETTITELSGRVEADTVIFMPVFRDTLLLSGNPNDVKYKSHTAGISLNYTLFNGLQNVWNYLGSKAYKKGTDYNYANALSDVTFGIKAEYYLVLKAKNDLEVAKQTVGRSEELLKLFEEKYELGSASLSEVLKQKVQYGNDQLTLLQAEKNLEFYLDDLAVDIGLDPQTEYDIADLDLRKAQISNINDLIAKATQGHPSVLGSQANIDVANYDVRSAWGSYMPNLSVGYSYSWSKDRFSDIIKFGSFDHSSRLSVTLSYNVFDGFSREYNMSRAKASLNNARASQLNTRHQVIRDIRDAHLDITVADKTLSVTEESERAASEDMDLVQAKYNLGAAALWELLDAQVSLKSAQFNKVRAEFDYNLALAKLQNAMGE